MVIERSKDEIIIRISDRITDRDLQSLTDYIAYVEARAASEGTQTQAYDNDLNSSSWPDNKDRLNTTTEKNFDCVQFVREQRDRIAEITKDMTPEEVVAYFKTVTQSSDLRP
jgi:hypothetical protein